jgi:hypothetical protein
MAIVAGIIADVSGPAVGGLFLAFPAIFAASATLIDKHERERKAQKGLPGAQRGRGAAALDAAGAGWGSMGLAAFAAVMWWQADRLSPIACLAFASGTWFLVAVAGWRLRRELRSAALTRQLK